MLVAEEGRKTAAACNNHCFKNPKHKENGYVIQTKIWKNLKQIMATQKSQCVPGEITCKLVIRIELCCVQWSINTASVSRGVVQGRTEVRWLPEQETSLAPPCSNLRSFVSKCTVLKKVLVTLLGLFGVPALNRRPGHCALLSPPRYALGVVPRKHKANALSKRKYEMVRLTSPELNSHKKMS